MAKSGIEFGGIVSDFRFEKKPATLPDCIQNWDTLACTLQGIGIELQPELYFLRDLPHNLQLQSSHTFVGVHQPCYKRDVLSARPGEAGEAHKDTLASMDMAAALNADYLVLHPVQTDRWEDREGQRKAARRYVEKIAEIKEEKKHPYRLCVENLEFPKYPSTFEETADLLDSLHSKGHEAGLIFDIAHHWHNLVHLLKQVPGYPLTTEDRYYDLLYSDLVLLCRRFGPDVIEGFHISQAYMEGEAHNTHGLPGLMDGQEVPPGEMPFSHPSGFKGQWLDGGQVIARIGNWMHDEDIPAMKIIIESHNRTETEMAAMAVKLHNITS